MHMQKMFCLLAAGIMGIFLCVAQADLPKDYLSPAFHAARRDSLRSRMPAHSVAVVFAYPTRTFSNDVSYPYHPNPDLYYFSGYREPNAVLLIFKERRIIKHIKTCFLSRKETRRQSSGQAAAWVWKR
jgi:Xaa-Pro aminopeptidase